jgi:hypothetical protein
MPHTAAALRLLLLACAAVLVLAACGEDVAIDAPEGTPTPTGSPDPTTPTPEPTPTPAEPEDPDDTADPEDPDGAERLAGEPSTEEQRVDPEPGDVAVVDVRVATHDDFDRVVLDIKGDGLAGWWVSYVDEARTAGRGETIPLEGDAVLSLSVQGATLPPSLPEGIEPWIGERLAGPTGGVVTELEGDAVFEGVHTIFVGVHEERPFLIERLEDPQRIVVDVVHD